MKFIAEIRVMPKKEILDPQGKAVMLGLHHLDLNFVQDVRVGKHIQLVLEAADRSDAEAYVRTACEKLLTNVITEAFEFTVIALPTE